MSNPWQTIELPEGNAEVAHFGYDKDEEQVCVKLKTEEGKGIFWGTIPRDTRTAYLELILAERWNKIELV